MNAYAELMAKIVKLDGWEWEWKFHDHLYVSDANDNWDGYLLSEIKYQKSTQDDMVVVQNGRTGGWTNIAYCIPLPTVEQWMEKFKSAKLNLRITYTGSLEYGWLVEVLRKQHDECHEEDYMCSLATLYARVVLGYRYEKGEFVKNG